MKDLRMNLNVYDYVSQGYYFSVGYFVCSSNENLMGRS